MGFFITEKYLLDEIETMTTGDNGKYRQRDFVARVSDFCVDGLFNGKLGIVYGLRSTGKTVGLLQVCGDLLLRGFKPAYARFNYDDVGVGEVNAQMQQLANEGFTHFFLDEATYLGGFMNMTAEWADVFTPLNRVKLIISGTDSFMLWLAENGPLVHRYVEFSTNYVSYPEYRRVFGGSFSDYKDRGGVIGTDSMPNFIQYAVVDNLVNTINHLVDDANRTNYYTSRLYGIDSLVIFKAVISILKCAVLPFITRHFVKNAATKNLPDLGNAIGEWSSASKRDIKKRIAESMKIYDDFEALQNPGSIIEALIEFLVRIGCLLESFEAFSDIGPKEKMYYFTHNALMNYAVQETIDAIAQIPGMERREFVDGITQAVQGCVNESVAFAHVLACSAPSDKVFKYRDPSEREVDIVSINRQTKKLLLIEIASKASIDERSVFAGEARHLFSPEVLENIGVDDSYSITRALVYQGESRALALGSKELLVINAEEFSLHSKDLEAFLESVKAQKPEHDDRNAQNR